MRVRIIQIISILLLPIFSSCIIFKESDLDPNRELSQLLGLWALWDLSRGYNLEAKVRLNDAGGVPSQFSVARVTKVDASYEFPDVINGSEEIGEHIGTFSVDTNAEFRLDIRTLGRFRLDFYQVTYSPSYRGSVVVDILSLRQPNLIVVMERMSPGFAFSSVSLRRLPFSPSPSSELPFNTKFYYLGEKNGVSLYRNLLILTKEFFVSSSRVSLNQYLVYFYTKDGATWNSLPLYETPIKLFYENGTVIQEDAVESSPAVIYQDSFYTLFLRKDNSDNHISTHLIQIPSQDPNQIQITPITPRGSNIFVSGDYLGLSGNKFFYRENINNVSTELRVESGPLDNPGSNLAVDIGNSTSPFFGNPDLSTLLFLDTGILRPTPTIITSQNNAGANVDYNYDHDIPLSPPNAENSFYTNPYLSILHEFETINANESTRISVHPSSFNFATITFSGGDTRTSPIASPLSRSKFNSTQTLFSILGTAPLQPVGLFRINHSNFSIQEIAYSTKPVQIIPNYTEDQDGFEYLGQLGDRIIHVREPTYTGGTPPQLSKRMFFSTTLDGQNWEDWKELDLQLPPKQ
jgi:hypothetical protein